MQVNKSKVRNRLRNTNHLNYLAFIPTAFLVQIGLPEWWYTWHPLCLPKSPFLCVLHMIPSSLESHWPKWVLWRNDNGKSQVVYKMIISLHLSMMLSTPAVQSPFMYHVCRCADETMCVLMVHEWAP